MSALEREIQQIAKAPLDALEIRIAALENNVESPSGYPCDCKHRLSLIEERFLTISEHTWERRLSALEDKQKREVKRLSELAQEHSEWRQRFDTLIGEYGWENGERVLEPSNLVSTVEQMLDKMKTFDMYKTESARSIKRLKRKTERIKADAISPQVNAQFLAEMSAIKSETEELKKRVEGLGESQSKILQASDVEFFALEVAGTKAQLANDLETIARKVDMKIKDLERTIAYVAKYSGHLNATESNFPWLQSYRSPERNIWVPATSNSPRHGPSYAHEIPLVLEQPMGWGEKRAQICRELEESQQKYFSTNADFEDSSDSTQETSDENSLRPSSDSTRYRDKSLKKKKRKPSVRLENDNMTSENELASREDGPYLRIQSNAFDQPSPQSPQVLTDGAHYPLRILTDKPALLMKPAPESSNALSVPQIDPNIGQQITRTLTFTDSGSSLRKYKRTSIKKNKARLKYIPVNELFTQRKPYHNVKENSPGKANISQRSENASKTAVG